MLKQTALLLVSFALTTSAMVNAQTPSDAPPPQVMVLGTFHFTGGGSDLINSEVDDFRSPRRQAEIAEVLDRLEAFAPTRILVELRPEHEADFNMAYQAWLAGERDLTVNERQQIGMALAGRLGHNRLYAVDVEGNMDFDGMMGAAANAGQQDVIRDFSAYADQIRALTVVQDAPERTVRERLIDQNSQPMRDMHSIYLLLAQMGPAENPAGAREMTNWWGRNLHIFANISRHAEPGERLLVIYGSGHKYLLDQFVDRAPNMVWVDPLPYLAD